MILNLLLLLLPTQLALHFWPNWSLVNGLRVDYLAPTLYLTDILILGLMLRHRKPARVPLLILFLGTLNTVFSVSPLLTLYKWLHAYEYYWLFRYLKSQFSIYNFQFTIKAAVIWTVVLAWLQFLNQGSIGGAWYWLGERTFNMTTPGIAKIFLGFSNLDLGFVLRPYATLSHPNALAGWLLLTGLVTNLWWLIVPTVLITFSRSGILLLGLVFIRRIGRIGLIGLITLVFLFPGNPTSLTERVRLNQLATTVIQKFPWWGTGLGAFIPASVAACAKCQLLPYQPVHNIFLLALAEWGLPLFAVFIVMIIKSWRPVFLIIALTGMVDHYWWTLHQNTLLFVVVLALSYNTPFNPPLTVRGGNPKGEGVILSP